MEDDLKESITQAVKERLASPLWGYIFLSWLGFNWQNIAILFMSDKTVEERISGITCHHWFFAHYLIAPIFLGAVLAAASPYLHQLLAWAHKKAKEKTRQSLKNKIIQKYEDDIDIAEKKVDAETATELAKAKRLKEITRVDEEKKRISLDTIELEKKYKQRESDLEEIEKSLKSTESKIKQLNDKGADAALKAHILFRAISEGKIKTDDLRKLISEIFTNSDYVWANEQLMVTSESKYKHYKEIIKKYDILL